MLTETADLGMPGLSVSAAASAAIQNLARSLAVEWAADNIRCNVVACGMIEGRDDPAFAMAAQRGIAPAARAHTLGNDKTALATPWAATHRSAENPTGTQRLPNWHGSGLVQDWRATAQTTQKGGG